MDDAMQKTPVKASKPLSPCISPVKIVSAKRIRFGSMSTINFHDSDPSTHVASSTQQIIQDVEEYDKPKQLIPEEEGPETSRNSSYLAQFDDEPDVIPARRSSVSVRASLSFSSDSDNNFLNQLTNRKTGNVDDLEVLLRDSSDEDIHSTSPDDATITAMHLNDILKEDEVLSDDNNDDIGNDDDHAIPISDEYNERGGTVEGTGDQRRSTRLTTLLREEVAKELLKEEEEDNDTNNTNDQGLYTSNNGECRTVEEDKGEDHSVRPSINSTRLTLLLQEEVAKGSFPFSPSPSPSNLSVMEENLLGEERESGMNGRMSIEEYSNNGDDSMKNVNGMKSEDAMNSMRSESNPSSMMDMDLEETLTLRHLLDGSMDGNDDGGDGNDMNKSTARAALNQGTGIGEGIGEGGVDQSMMSLSDTSELPLVQDLLDNPMFNQPSSASTTTTTIPIPIPSSSSIALSSQTANAKPISATIPTTVGFQSNEGNAHAHAHAHAHEHSTLNHTTTTKRMSFGFDQESDNDNDGGLSSNGNEEERRRRSRRSTISLTDMQTALLRELDKYDRRSSILSLPPPPSTTTSTAVPIPTTTSTTTISTTTSITGNDIKDNDNKTTTTITTTHSLTHSLPPHGLSTLIQEYDCDSQAMDIEEEEEEESGLIEKRGSQGLKGGDMQDEVNTTMDLQMMADQLKEEIERGDGDSTGNLDGNGKFLRFQFSYSFNLIVVYYDFNHHSKERK